MVRVRGSPESMNWNLRLVCGSVRVSNYNDQGCRILSEYGQYPVSFFTGAVQHKKTDNNIF